MQRLLFIQIAEKSFDEVFLVERITQNWTQNFGETEVYALTNGISHAFLSSRQERIVGVLTENQEENKTRFDDIVEKIEADAIFVLDLHEYFLHPLELNFLPVWLKDQTMPVYAIDYFNLLDTENNQIILKENIELDQFEAGEAPLPLDIDIHILKPSLPNLPQQENLTFNTASPELVLKSPQLRKEILDSIEAGENEIAITLIFDPTLFSQALERNILAYYFVLTEVVIFYLRQFRDHRFQLFIVGSAPPTHEINLDPNINVQLHYFSHLTEDNYAAFLGASDLIISNSDWAVTLLDAMYLKTPVCVFGNSIIQEWKDDTETEKELRASFQPLKPLYDLCQLFMDLNQFSITTPIFQFISYPVRDTQPDFPEPGLQQKAFPYFLLDMFDDRACMFILQHLLFSSETQQKYAKLCDDLLEVTQDVPSISQIHCQIRDQIQDSQDS